jgi:hypothetical protein
VNPLVPFIHLTLCIVRCGGNMAGHSKVTIVAGASQGNRRGGLYFFCSLTVA